MQKPQNYDTTQARTIEFDRPSPGAQIMTIHQAHEVRSSTNRPMFVLLMDISEGRHVGYFNKLFNIIKAKSQFAKWPCVYRRCTDGDQVGFFKGDITSIEKSNNIKFTWDLTQLKGLKVGCVLGEKEINAEGKTILEPRILCSVQKVREGRINPPSKKRFQEFRQNTEHPADGYSQYPQGDYRNDPVPF